MEFAHKCAQIELFLHVSTGQLMLNTCINIYMEIRMRENILKFLKQFFYKRI